MSTIACHRCRSVQFTVWNGTKYVCRKCLFAHITELQVVLQIAKQALTTFDRNGTYCKDCFEYHGQHHEECPVLKIDAAAEAAAKEGAGT